MGSSVSQEVNAKASESISVINSQTQDCVSTYGQTEVLTVCGSVGCSQSSSIDIEGISLGESALYTTQCSANINITDDIRAKINADFALDAKAIAQQFQLSVAEVDQVVNVASKIAVNIDNTTVQNCIQMATQNEGLVVNCGTPAGGTGGLCNIIIKQVNFSEGLTPINNCILTENNATSVINQVTQMIEAQGSSKTESIFGPLIAIIVVIIIIIAAVFLGGTKALTDWRLWIVVIVVVLIYLGLAFWRHWFPFEKKST